MMTLVRKGQGPEILVMKPELVKFHEYVFVLTHARSHSTLLCHILGSHPQICGYTEVLIPYETAVDLIRLNCEVFRAGNYRGDSRYVMDKVIYDDYPVADAVLGLPRVTPIFLIREPEAAISSHVRMILREHEQGIVDWGPAGADPVAITEAAAEYYIKRLASLRTFCGRLEAMGKRGLFLTAEGLMDETAASFRLIERELGLREPLREEYRLFKHTGETGYGDTAETIRAGRIVRDRNGRDERPISIRRELLEYARRAYDFCLAAFQASAVMARVGE